MHVAKPANDSFVGGRVTFDFKAGVFHLELVQNVEQALFIDLTFGIDGQPQHGLGKFQRTQMDVIFSVRVVQHAVKIYLFDFCNGAQISWHQGRNFDKFLALQLIQMADLDGFFCIANKKLGLFFKCALVHAEYAYFAHVRVSNNFEHVRDHMQRRIGLDRIGRRIISACAAKKRCLIAFHGVGCKCRQHVQQLGDACTGFR